MTFRCASMRVMGVIGWCVVGLLLTCGPTLGEDWPAWRYDARRGAASGEQLPQTLQLQWKRQLPQPRPAWPNTQEKLQFDGVPEPVVAGQRLFVPSTRNDDVTAFDTETGALLWRYQADGPVRFAPLAYQDKVYFVSDDGHLYCLSAADGQLVWKVNGGPSQRWVVGNHRLVSSWPARGAPAVHEGRIYFAASIWSFMGIFVHCVDAQSGEVIWTNGGDGTNYTIQPHDAPAFASVVPQGNLVATGDTLIVPGGRSVPAGYDLHTGKLKFFQYDKRSGHYDVAATSTAMFVGDLAYELTKGDALKGTRPAVFDRATAVYLDDDKVLLESSAQQVTKVTSTDRRGRETSELVLERSPICEGSIEGPVPTKVMIGSGTRIYGVSDDDEVVAIELEDTLFTRRCKSTVVAKTDGPPVTMLSADGKLFVVDQSACLYCFGGRSDPPRQYAVENVPLGDADEEAVRLARGVIEQTNVRQGYCVLLGLSHDELPDALLQQTQLDLLVVDQDPQRIQALRERMTVAGLYGERIAAYVDEPRTMPLPPYLANLVICAQGHSRDDATDVTIVQQAFRILRPYGGVACFRTNRLQADRFAEMAASLHSQGAVTRRGEPLSLLVRQGPLPESDDWTHQYGNKAQTGMSSDRLVKAPLGVLWWGGPSHDGILPRHGHGPSPQVAGGRLFIEGEHKLRAVDVYTGRLLWEADLPDFGKYYNITAHFPGAGEIGSNYVSLPDAVYAVLGDRIWELDAASGQRLKSFRLQTDAEQSSPFWGFIAADQDLLIATCSPVTVVLEKERRDSDREEKQELPKNTRALVRQGADWQYLATAKPLDPSWVEEPDNVEGWKNGAAGFGYGDDDDKTVLDDGVLHVYIRQEFQLASPKDIERVGLMVRYDDAFVAYLNGKEVAREGVRTGGDGQLRVESHEADEFEYVELKDARALLRTGRNVLSIEGHNTNASSSDFTLDPYLVAEVKGSPVADADQSAEDQGPALEAELKSVQYGSGSRRLVVFNRHTGELLWSRDANYSFRHNNIAIGDGKIFCIDSITELQKASLQRRGVELDQFQPRMLALDLRNGDLVWSRDQNVFGSFLSYSAQHDCVIQAGSKARDRAEDEVGTGMTAIQGKTGQELWANMEIKYDGPCLLWRDFILTNGTSGFAVDIHTGKPTGWNYARNYGCNTVIGGENLLTFRSGAAGFFDLANDGGTGNLGGFRSSCTANLIIADGVLNAPDYTRTCTCAYQNQTSLAMVHMPDADLWTFGATDRPGQLGINFGAPGDRRAENGTLWTDFPVVGGKSPEREVTIESKEARYFRHHPTRLAGQTLNWVAASGVEDPGRIQLKMPESCADSTATLRLVFTELDEDVHSGDRVFDVEVQGETVLREFDIAGQTGLGRVVIREFEVSTGKSLEIRLVPTTDSQRKPLLCGLELLLVK